MTCRDTERVCVSERLRSWKRWTTTIKKQPGKGRGLLLGRRR